MATETQETIADIIAEARDKYTVHECNQCAWRKCCSRGFGSEECGKFRESIFLKLGIEDGYFTQLLDRLEAAYKREKAAIEADALAVGGIVEAARKRKRGDCAKLREALLKANGVLIEAAHHNLTEEYINECLALIHAALAAPPRNCDALSAQEQTEKFNQFCQSHRNSDLPKCAGCPLEDIPDGTGCAQAWAQMSYTEGGNDGK